MLTVTFQVDLSLPTSEAMGPKTNQTMQGTLSPDRYVSGQNPITEYLLEANRPNTRSTWLPTGIGMPAKVGGGNIGARGLKHGDQFVLTGNQAIYAMKSYVKGSPYSTYDQQVLTIVSMTF